MNCHCPTEYTPIGDDAPVVLVGNPNVGKSVLFGALTQRYVDVSNYPGTTVEVSHGTLRLNGHTRPVIDTPGIQSITPFSDDERVTRDILLDQTPATVVQVVDTKNLRRGLLIAMELADAGIPFVLNLNMADEAAARGVYVDTEQLSDRLGVPVVSTIATRGEGLELLAHCLGAATPASYKLGYYDAIEDAVLRLMPYLPNGGFSPRALALMLLAGDDDLLERFPLTDTARAAIAVIRQNAEDTLGEPLAVAITNRRLAAADAIMADVVEQREPRPSLLQQFGRLAVHPVAGWPVLAAVLYLVYLFVGVFGAGTLVDLLETRLFGELINPWAARIVTTLVPIELVQAFLIGEYGVITMALTYGLAIVLPIVGTFFLTFSLLEDSGYLPRLAVMLDRAFRMMGLNGKAVLPMILGLGCDTMATMSTRILESRKERIVVTLLLALGVPCSAQLGVILGMIAGLGTVATAIWAGVVVFTLLAVGYLAARALPGERSDFILELPPMRIPSLRNIVMKTVARMEWYLREVIPVFVLGTAFLFVIDRMGVLASLETMLAPVIVGWLGLPADVTGAFLVGFLRRDYGATELYTLARAGALDPIQITVSLVTITLFMPCIANLLMIVKEHGMKIAVAVAAFVFPFAIVVGGLVNWALHTFGILGIGYWVLVDERSELPLTNIKYPLSDLRRR